MLPSRIIIKNDDHEDESDSLSFLFVFLFTMLKYTLTW